MTLSWHEAWANVPLSAPPWQQDPGRPRLQPPVFSAALPLPGVANEMGP